MESWLMPPPRNLAGVLFSTVVFYFLMILISKIFGLRSFSNLSGFDFIITLSMGAILAATILNKNNTLIEGAVALFTLFLLQQFLAFARIRWRRVIKWTDTQPMLLMDGPKMLRDNMRKARITEEELRSRLRAHNINSYTQINAVVLEKSGDISVLYSKASDQTLDPDLLKGVRH